MLSSFYLNFVVKAASQLCIRSDLSVSNFNMFRVNSIAFKCFLIFKK